MEPVIGQLKILGRSWLSYGLNLSYGAYKQQYFPLCEKQRRRREKVRGFSRDKREKPQTRTSTIVLLVPEYRFLPNQTGGIYRTANISHRKRDRFFPSRGREEEAAGAGSSSRGKEPEERAIK